ncbi:yjef n-terminal domain containing protein [Grosmannia clavigera kw1407]|uniref:Enhancer of mRNA-decapping protein 3 n=1 Tax=Grosmannia clavigera (strain kw1407 / UAMH 11150) TaxID=655863 RepID=F0XHJ7_GROCL|nr:yjef n-terminal domain containing protein [Grosmannia clavigera kw1407]EFX03011.1 yjef n-terminal domain containing protein [Grosmannia clavigera kw1407]
MASEFLRMVVIVELRDPPERLHGSVTGVEAGQSLTLSNVWSLDTHSWRPQVVVNPANIVEIFDASKDPAKPPAPASDQQTSTPPVYDDPAILSFKFGTVRPDSGPGSCGRPSSKTRQAASTGSTGTNHPQFSRAAVQDASIRGLSVKAPAADSGPFQADDSRVAISPLNATGELDTTTTNPHAVQPEDSQKARRRPRQPRMSRADHSGETIRAPVERQKFQAGRGKGWRETPMLQDTASFQPFNALKKGGQRRRQQPSQENGWASEDVTDVQEMGDFDFEGGLAKFDKRTLFDQMRREDEVAVADRLVTHNRRPLPKPGTASGKNLHYSENVLDVPPTAASLTPKSIVREPQAVSHDFWNSEADDVGAGKGASGGGGRSSGREFESRQSSRRDESKAPNMRRSQSRKASASTAGQGPARPHATSARVQHGSVYSERSQAQTSFPASTCPRGLYLLPSKRRLETVSALQMLNLENIAHNEMGLTEDMMAENAGRGIAEATLIALADPAIKIRTGATAVGSKTAVQSSASSSPATVVVLSGNNKSGIRAVAGARHLRNRGINVLVCVVGIERGERELLEDFRQQIRLYRNFGGRIYTKSELFEYLRKATIPTLTVDTPRSAVVARPPAVALIVDALLGLAISFDELRTGDQATVYELIKWANRNEAFVLAVDVPTGIDPTSGKVSIIDGTRLYVRPRYVIAMGAPKRGLLEAVSAGEAEDGTLTEPAVLDDPALDWRLFIADIGLGVAAWKKAGTKIRRGIDFDDKWLLGMKYFGDASGRELD